MQKISKFSTLFIFLMFFAGILFIHGANSQRAFKSAIYQPAQENLEYAFISGLESSVINYENASVISDGFADIWGWNNDTSDYPDIVVDSDNNLHVVWQDSTKGSWGGGDGDKEIMYANYSASGWSNATVISDDETGWNTLSSYDPVIAVDASNNLHVVWEETTNGDWGSDTEIMYVNYTASGWSDATVISDDETAWNTGESIDPDIGVDSNNDLHVVWVDETEGPWGGVYPDWEIMYANYTSSGWSNATVISDGFADIWGWNNDTSVHPDIVVDSDNNLHVVWEDDTEGPWGGGSSDSEIMYAYYTNSSWSNATVISDKWGDGEEWNTGNSRDPTITIDTSDNIHVVWEDYTEGPWGGGSSDYEIMYAYYTNSSWSNATVISDKWGDGEEWNTGNSFRPAFAVDASDNLHVVWGDYTPGVWGSGGLDMEIMYTKITQSSEADGISPIGGTDDDDDDDDKDEPIIPFGHYYLMFMGIGIISLLVYKKHKKM
ncbi:MAG: hypothetical protein GF383_08465 [Candidatus Lokiarchaeota archaeon]|nr:hypothetical protein [Candidatus Lokiarchaeota archaeon]MBD3340406.1 hypothetical protein [Candidatus Lokiarchaeota archaeon]